jgi:hypothetical protein
LCYGFWKQSLCFDWIETTVETMWINRKIING